MAATVEIRELSTASVTGFDRTSQQVRFYSANTTATNALTNPITIPTSGSDWSFTKQLRFYIGGTAPSNYISSPQFYSSFSGGWGGGATASYVLVEYDKNATTFQTHTSASIIGTDISTVTSGAPASLGDQTATWSSTTSYFGTILRLQMEVGNEASPGTLGNQTVTFTYNEQ